MAAFTFHSPSSARQVLHMHPGPLDTCGPAIPEAVRGWQARIESHAHCEVVKRDDSATYVSIKKSYQILVCRRGFGLLGCIPIVWAVGLLGTKSYFSSGLFCIVSFVEFMNVLLAGRFFLGGILDF